MKHLKSSSRDLRELFSRNIAVSYITEPLASFDDDASAQAIRQFLSDHEYDVIGVRRDGVVVGYARATELAGGRLGDHQVEFVTADLIDETAPLIDAISAMRKSSHLFVRTFGRVNGIVTRGDIQKAPVRMWLFGLVSLIEMQLLRIIRESQPDNGWEKYLSDRRLDAVKRLLAERQRRNEGIDLVDCLQFCDKRDIVMKDQTLRSALGFVSRSVGEKLLEDLEDLRNNLAHSQDIVTQQWPKTVDLAEQAEALLLHLEGITISPETAA
jgi:hypothetical protein